MWAYNSILKCAVNGRVPFISTLWKQSSLFPRVGFSSSPQHTLPVPAPKPSALTLVFSPFVRRNLHLNKGLLSETESNLAKDVVLFKFDNVKLFKWITLFGCVNFVMFMTLSMNIYTVLSRQGSVEEVKTSEFESDTFEKSDAFVPPVKQSNWGIMSLFSRDESSEDRGKEPVSSTFMLTALCGVTFALGKNPVQFISEFRMFFQESTYTNCLCCLFPGYVVLIGTYVYCSHMVRYLVLRKCGKKVTIITHGMFGNNRVSTWNLNEVFFYFIEFCCIYQVLRLGQTLNEWPSVIFGCLKNCVLSIGVPHL